MPDKFVSCTSMNGLMTQESLLVSRSGKYCLNANERFFNVAITSDKIWNLSFDALRLGKHSNCLLIDLTVQS